MLYFYSPVVSYIKKDVKSELICYIYIIRIKEFTNLKGVPCR